VVIVETQINRFQLAAQSEEAEDIEVEVNGDDARREGKAKGKAKSSLKAGKPIKVSC